MNLWPLRFKYGFLLRRPRGPDWRGARGRGRSAGRCAGSGARSGCAGASASRSCGSS